MVRLNFDLNEVGILKKLSFNVILLILILSLMFSCIGCTDKRTESNSLSSGTSELTSSTDEGNDKIMAQREYFKNNPVKEVRSFDVRLRDSKTTRTLKIMSDGMRLTEVTISPINGKRLGSPVTVVHFSDIHFNAVNKEDEQNPTIMALFEGRNFNRGNKYNTEAATRSLEFGKLFDRTVITGDILDHYSFGSMELLRSVITNKYDVLMTLGNHETAEIMPSINGGMKEKYTLDEKFNYLNDNIWTNDVYLHSEILSDKDGNEKVMLLLLDNSTNKYLYNEEQLKQLEGFLETARQKQIPALIFQHCPISTGWGDKDGNELVEPYDIIDNPNGVNANYGKSSDLCGGSANTDDMSKRVYDLITKNGDVVKGVFCGHEHNNIYTEIMATTPDGANARIPQYTVSGNYAYSNVIQITIL